ncbi:macrophage migration inhibitory factor isoform X2 [Ambystoma mexicanum]|uniref:macrophage migration inhibitory factor isoform X2 n=1 Tax=Ambystoma mexicanum TaxID=8296 RepID=UPI0037E85EDF
MFVRGQCAVNRKPGVRKSDECVGHKERRGRCRPPPPYIAVYIVPGQMMSFGGTTDPCALCSLHSIGKIGGPQNKAYSKLICDLLAKQLHISADRVYINYVDMNAANVGWNGSTFA